jgi:hypothetical protein
MVSSLFLQGQHQLIRVRPRLLRLSIVRILSKATVQVKKEYEVEPSPAKRSSREIDKTFQTVVKCNSSSHQIQVTFWGPQHFISLSNGFLKSTIDWEMQQRTQDPNHGRPWENLGSIGHKCQKRPCNPTLRPLCHKLWNRVLEIRTWDSLLHTIHLVKNEGEIHPQLCRRPSWRNSPSHS